MSKSSTLTPDPALLTANGVRFLTKASVDANSNSNESDGYLFACVHASAGLELLFKARLAREHWTLIYESPESAASARDKKSDPRTVGAANALARLRGVCNVSFDENDLKSINSIRRTRNDALHYDLSIRCEHARALVARALHVAFVFLDSELKAEAAGLSRQIDQLRRAAAKFDEFVKERMKQVAIGDAHVITCPICRQRSVLYDEWTAKCEVCHHELSMEELPHCPMVHCPLCGHEALRAYEYYDEVEPDESGGVVRARVVCTRCLNPGDLTECPRCEALHDGDFFCESCQSWVDRQ